MERVSMSECTRELMYAQSSPARLQDLPAAAGRPSVAALLYIRAPLNHSPRLQQGQAAKAPTTQGSFCICTALTSTTVWLSRHQPK